MNVRIKDQYSDAMSKFESALAVFARVRLNAPMNSVRMAAAGRLFGDQRCAFCQSAPDSLSHVSQCPAVLAAYDGVASLAGLPPLLDARRALLLQDDWDGASVAGTVATFAAVWEICGGACSVHGCSDACRAETSVNDVRREFGSLIR